TRATADFHGAGIGAQQARRDLGESRLSRAVRPLEGDDFPPAHLEPHALQHRFVRAIGKVDGLEAANEVGWRREAAGLLLGGEISGTVLREPTDRLGQGRVAKKRASLDEENAVGEAERTSGSVLGEHDRTAESPDAGEEL